MHPRNTFTYDHPRARLDTAQYPASGSIMSPAQQVAFNERMGAAGLPTGGYRGCAYLGFNNGVVCQNQSLSTYQPRQSNFYSKWVANVDYDDYSPDMVATPNIQAPGGMDQVYLGGGPGYTTCGDACSCQNDVDCTCQDGPEKCGWVAVNHDCLQPVPNGTYPSLSACEAAQSLGFYGK